MAVIVVVIVVIVVYFKCVRAGRQVYRKWKDGMIIEQHHEEEIYCLICERIYTDDERSQSRRSLTLSDDDANTGVNESSQYLFDSHRVAQAKGEHVDHDVVVKTGSKAHRSKTSSPQLHSLEESTI